MFRGILLSLWIAVFITFCFSSAAAGRQQYRLIRDAEIEVFLRETMQVLLAHSHRDAQIQIGILQSFEANAFVIASNRIFITTGLLRLVPDTEALAAVIAHELGHIYSGHIAELQYEQQKSKQQLLAAILLSIPVSLATQSVEAGLLTAGIGAEAVQQGLFSYSRALEDEADLFSLRLLQQARISGDAVLRALKALQQRSQLFAEPSIYVRTHNLTPQRIRDISLSLSTSAPDAPTTNSALRQLDPRLNRIQAKLAAYEDDLSDLSKQHPDVLAADIATIQHGDQESDARLVMAAIAAMRNWQLPRALEIGNKLLHQQPHNRFNNELLGDIALQAGMPELAQQQYQLALQQVRHPVERALFCFSWLRAVNANPTLTSSATVANTILPIISTNPDFTSLYLELAKYYGTIKVFPLQQYFQAEADLRLGRNQAVVARIKPLLAEFSAFPNYQQRVADLLLLAQQRLAGES